MWEKSPINNCIVTDIMIGLPLGIFVRGKKISKDHLSAKNYFPIAAGHQLFKEVKFSQIPILLPFFRKQISAVCLVSTSHLKTSKHILSNLTPILLFSEVAISRIGREVLSVHTWKSVLPCSVGRSNRHTRGNMSCHIR